MITEMQSRKNKNRVQNELQRLQTGTFKKVSIFHHRHISSIKMTYTLVNFYGNNSKKSLEIFNEFFIKFTESLLCAHQQSMKYNSLLKIIVECILAIEEWALLFQTIFFKIKMNEL